MAAVLSSKCIEKLEIIGYGSFGRVFKCRDLRTDEFVAVKEIDLDGGSGSDDCFEELRAEISTLMTCDHVNIIRYRGSYIPNNLNRPNDISSPLSNRLCIVMDYCDRGSLRQLLDNHGPLPEPLIAETAESILKALEYLHKQGISHRDLKGANVLVDEEGKIKLGDFGVAFQNEFEGEGDDNKIVGSPYWMAPEVLSPASKYHDASKADIWSFGITLIELLRGRPPLHYLTPRAAMAAIPRTSPPRLESDDPGASKMLRELIHACLHDDPRRRPSASQLLKSFKSYFKQQKYNTIPGSLAKLGKKNNSNDNKNNNEVKNLKIHRSETIYSQWDFDLNTLTIDEVLLEPVNESIKPEIETERDLVKTLESIIKDDEVATIPEVLEAANIIGTISEIPNQQQKRSVNFRKLEPKYQRQKIKIKIVGGEWDNKDISILPIPCPKDAPDLSRPQRY